ncbi:MAG: fibro-slime domain-containing protein [Clostridiales bacterium]|nr:fibro-slime domain-containing protein [Clostridiales bacterium]
MKRKQTKRILSIAMAAALSASPLPVAALAATDVTPSPTKDDESKLNVEYFSSTMYNWDENAANAATAVADSSSGTVSYTSTNVSYSNNSNYSSYTTGNYYVLVDGSYYVVTGISCTRSGRQYSWTVTYTNASGGSSTTTGSNSTFTLYSVSSSTSYEGKGLYFTNGSNKQSSPTFSNWLDDAQNYMIYSGLAESNLAESTNAPFDNDTVNAANLFATDGSNTSYTDVYTNVGVPFVYDEDTGYYTLDSDQYAVYFDGGTSDAASNTNLTIADLPAAHSYTAFSGYSYATGFLPFNDVNTTTVTAVKSGGSSSGGTTAYTTSGDTVWGFGMALSVNFAMTEDGKITITNEDGEDVAEDIIFEFSGDDDVWVYVDNTLALDIGGTHDAITGTINFASGDVTLTAGSYGQIGDLSGKTSTSAVTTSSSLSQTNLYTALDTTLSTFAGGGTHTLTVYYMERGRGRSNCKIKFNLPQTDTVSVTKQLNTTDSKGQALSEEELDTAFTFTLYKNGSVVTDTDYIVQNANGVIVKTDGNTGSDGTFTLKGGQTAVFDLSLDGYRTYYVTETNPSTDETYYEEPSWTYSSNISNTNYVTTSSSAWTSDTAQLTGSKDTAESLTFVCTNTKSYAPSVKVNAVDDVVVIDYNLPVTVDVLKNDEVIGNDSKVTISTQGNDGSSTANTDNTITYTLKNVLSEVDSVKYTLTATDTVDNTTTANDTATLSVVPASSVYYEDDFATSTTDGVVGITYSGNWTTVNGDSTATQSSDNIIYGTDATYADDTTYSNGSVTSATFGASATFTFKGTGVDIYSSTTSTACIVYAYLYEGDSTSGTMKQYAMVNNYADDGQYYVVPTVSFADLDYGTYTVMLKVLPNSADSSAITYYIDGIRVYNPLGTVTNDGSIAGNAYAAANELNAVYTEIRTMLLDKDADLTGGDGALFIDEITDSTTGETTTELATYESDGPEHETYLKVGNGVAFMLSGFDADSDAVYVGIKLTGITTGTSATSGTVEVTNGSEKTTLNITSTADQYYRITPDADGNVVIKNTSDTGAVISLTKIRTTSADSADSDENAISVTSDEDTAVYALSTFSTLSLTSSSGEVLSEDEAEDGSDEDTTADTETGDEAAGDVVIETPEEPEQNSSTGSAQQNSFSNKFHEVSNWMSGRR